MKHAKSTRVFSLLALVLVVTMLLTLVGCGGDPEKPDTTKTTTSTTATTTTAADSPDGATTTGGEVVDDTTLDLDALLGTTTQGGGTKTPMAATDIPDDDFEDKKVAKHPSPDKNYYILYTQLTAPTDGLVGVSLTLYASDDTLLDSVEFYFAKDGQDCVAKDVARVTWNGDKTVSIKMADSANTVYTMADKRG